VLSAVSASARALPTAPSGGAAAALAMAGCGCNGRLQCATCAPQQQLASAPTATIAVEAPAAAGRTEPGGAARGGPGREGGEGGARGEGRRSGGSGRAGVRLTPEQEEVVAKLRRRDAEVRAHEQAHVAAAGGLASAPSYVFQKGPDGALYAIGGHVDIDTSAVPGDPAATAAKMAVVQRAALAPAEPSGQDAKVAAAAAQAMAAARIEQAQQALRPEEGGRAEADKPEADRAAGGPRGLRPEQAEGRGAEPTGRDADSSSRDAPDEASRRAATIRYAAAAQAGRPADRPGALADIAA